MSWLSYRFEETPTLSREEVRALREIARLCPGPDAGAQLRRALGQSLQRLQRAEESVAIAVANEGAAAFPTADHASSTQPHPESAETTSVPGRTPVRTAATSADDLVFVRRHGSAAHDRWAAGAHPVRVFYGLGQQDLRAILELPLASVRSIIGAVVEVSPERLGASDLLTTVEQGVLAFFAERIATGVTERVHFLAPLMPVTILDVVCENCGLDWGADGPGGWYSISAVIRVAGLSLPFRLVLPWAALERARRGGRIGDGDEARLRRHRDHWIRTLGNAPVELRGHLGRAEILLSDLRQLEVTDILLFEPAGIEEVDGELRGPLALTQAEDGFVRIETEIIADETLLQLRVQSLVSGTSPRTEEELRVSDDRKETGVRGQEPGPDPESTRPPDTLPAGAGSLPGRAAAEDTPIQLRIELGRLRLTLRELAELSPGAILEMRRDPSAPVSLVVGDRVIGTGDLVRVEGELGVRIASLV